MNSWENFFFYPQKHSGRLINCSHLEYFNNVFNNFSGQASFNPLEAYGGAIQLLDLIKNISICVPKDDRKSYGVGIWGWVAWQNFHFWVNYPFKIQIKPAPSLIFSQCDWSIEFAERSINAAVADYEMHEHAK